MSQTIYLFGVMVRPPETADLARMPGLLGGLLPSGLENWPGLTPKAIRSANTTRSIAAIGLPLPGFLKARLESLLADPKSAPELLIAHDRIIQTLFSYGDILPSRFGLTVPDEAALQSWLSQSADDLEARLAAIGGADEWVIKVVRRVSDHDDPGRSMLQPQALPKSGGDFLRAKLAARQTQTDNARRQRSILQDLQRSLGDLARECAQAMAPAAGDNWRFKASYLIDRHARAALQSLLDDYSRSLAEMGMDLQAQGPWPAYSFCARAAA